MVRKRYSTKLFYKYYMQWIRLYKEDAIRPVTLEKYYLTYRMLRKLAPDLHLNELDRRAYQAILNKYALTHERKTVMDFHHHLKASLVDAVDDGIIERDPSRRVIIKGQKQSSKKTKFLSLYQLQQLLRQLDLGPKISWDWFILLVSKTGLRYAEALALTPKDFNFQKSEITINKSWDYKSKVGHFQPTKNKSSNRVVIIDWRTANQFKPLIAELDPDQPIFVPEHKRVFNSTINSKLNQYCRRAGIPVISIHGLRHTHASLLLFEGVSIASVAKRLGHANTITTQQTYLHIIQELENKDNDKVMQHLSKLDS
ncbi:site-specific integrase [Limosilactobacillus reuteri]|uniref:site-specific integrase n=1 Tax=Limosilactobacillus reuteri TaxID=1598 RepID=UPI000F4EB9A5|nr:site-specific integrase [Limosilactobacillus reuteri]MDZ5438540.1 site-specific integrase [Limosilactobacillus reuteri]ROV63176.1 site-specific integrase [Limosilactobacillus reuteri]